MVKPKPDSKFAAQARNNLRLASRHSLLGHDRRLAAAGAARPDTAETPVPAGADSAASAEEFEAWRKENPERAGAVEEVAILLARGQIPPAAAFGIRDEELLEAACIGVRQLKLGRHEDAVALFEGLTAAAPSIPHFHVSLGQALQGLGRPEEAVRAYGAAIERLGAAQGLGPRLLADALLLRGQLLARLGRKDEALADLRQALERLQSPADLAEVQPADSQRLPARIRQVQLMIETLQGSAGQNPTGSATARPIQG
jgi:tetratricopeptide (TPR) repeat protein